MRPRLQPARPQACWTCCSPQCCQRLGAHGSHGGMEGMGLYVSANGKGLHVVLMHHSNCPPCTRRSEVDEIALPLLPFMSAYVARLKVLQKR